jgi:hypothetical protein
VGGGTGNYAQYRAAFNTRKLINSPFIINLDGNYAPDTRNGSITAEIIATGTPPTNLYLRYAAVETDIEYAWSGEDSVFFVERTMFPSATGVSISLSAGDTIYDTQGFTLDPGWDITHMYIAVFIQRDTNKEVQQAAKWTIPINIPAISYVDNLIDDSATGDNDNRADPGETVDMIVTLKNADVPFQPATNVSMTITNSDPEITINDGTANFPDMPNNAVVDNSSDPYNFSVDGGASVHKTTFVYTITADPGGYTKTDSFEIMIGRPDIIFIDNDGGESAGNIESYFYDAIDDIGGLLYDIATDSAIEINHLSEYSVVIWFTGNLRNGTVSSTAQTTLSNYLDGGGKLFITGQDVGYDIGGTSFYSDYLKAVFTSDDANYWYVLGVDGDPIGDGFGFLISGGGGANNQGSPDIISKMADSDTVFEYAGTIGPCAVRYNSGTFKTVYFSFGFEAIQSAQLREDVLTRVLQWFDILAGIEEDPFLSQRPFVEIAPNPFVSMMKITVKNITSPRVEIQDVTGRVVWSSQETGESEISWNGKDFSGRSLPAGIYFCNVKSGNTTVKTEKVIMVR